jgi:hypothetical protein
MKQYETTRVAIQHWLNPQEVVAEGHKDQSLGNVVFAERPGILQEPVWRQLRLVGNRIVINFN